MAGAKVKKGAGLICVPCGRQVVISNWGISRTTLWCCGRPMKKKTTSLVKKIKSKLLKKKR
jgi:hypothetical protein